MRYPKVTHTESNFTSNGPKDPVPQQGTFLYLGFGENGVFPIVSEFVPNGNFPLPYNISYSPYQYPRTDVSEMYFPNGMYNIPLTGSMEVLSFQG